jgi:hypothetical protein
VFFVRCRFGLLTAHRHAEANYVQVEYHAVVLHTAIAKVAGLICRLSCAAAN